MDYPPMHEIHEMTEETKRYLHMRKKQREAIQYKDSIFWLIDQIETFERTDTDEAKAINGYSSEQYKIIKDVKDKLKTLIEVANKYGE